MAVAVAVVLVPALSSPAAAATVAQRTSASALHRYETHMVALLNKERLGHGEKAVTMNKKLGLAAHRHNLTMAKANQMSHHLPGEAFLADRISRTGYNWQAAGENIGCNISLSNAGIMSLQRKMYSEKAPNNGHRLNILDKSFTQVGIDVYYDTTHHKLWFTQDFGHPMS